MSYISKKWRKALKLWSFKRDNPGIKVIEANGEYFYKGWLLQERTSGESNFYYEKVLYKIDIEKL